MAAAEAKLSFDLAVDSVLDSLERKFLALLPTGFLSLYIRHLV